MSHEAVMSHEEDAAERKGFGGEREMCATPSGFMNQASSGGGVLQKKSILLNF